MFNSKAQDELEVYPLPELRVVGRSFKPMPCHLYAAAASRDVEKFARYIELGGDVNARDASYKLDMLAVACLGARAWNYFRTPQNPPPTQRIADQHVEVAKEQEANLLAIAKIYVAAGGDIELGFVRGDYDLIENSFPSVYHYIEDVYSKVEPKPTRESLEAEGIDFDPLKNGQVLGAEKYEKEQVAREKNLLDLDDELTLPKHILEAPLEVNGRIIESSAKIVGRL